MLEVLLAFLGWFFGAIATIAIALWIERIRSPSLKLTLEPPVPFPPGVFGKNWRSLRIRVSNERPSYWPAWLVIRLPAQQCRAEISVLRVDGTAYFEKPITGRWANTPEPLVVFVKQDAAEVPVLVNAQSLKSSVDIYPGDSEILDVAVRVDGEDSCYIWNDQTYAYLNKKNPDHKLENRIFLIRTLVTSSGQKCVGHFRLHNDGPFASFCLAELTAADRNALFGPNPYIP